MPDSDLADDSVLTSSFYNTYIREQVVVTCTSATRPTGVEGRLIFETDTNKLMVYNGSAWSVVGGSGWTSFTPSWSGLTVGNGTNSGEYCYIPGGLSVRVTFTLGSTSSVTGPVALTLPNSETIRASAQESFRTFGAATLRDAGTASHVGVVQYNGTTTVSINRSTVSGSNVTMSAISSTAPFTWTTGDIMLVEFTVPL